MSLKRNVIANYLGQGWAAVMGLAFVPLYIRYLGMEAYGLIGLFAVMQAWLTILDMGMTPTLGREMARFTSGAHSPQSIRNLLRSLEIICVSVATLICVIVWAASGWLASDWLKAEKLPTGVVRDAIAVMALVVAFRFVEGIYRSALFGLQRQVWYNAVNAALATLRSVGAVTLLAAVSPTLEAFFLWQAFVSLVSIIIFATGVHRALPRAPASAAFSAEALLGVWRFASGMMGITLLAILLTQVDKVLLSRLLSLEAFGYYTLAATVAGALYLLVTPITTALYPRLVEFSSRTDSTALKSVYHQGAQLITVATAPAAVLLAFFGQGVVFAWSGDSTVARGAGSILSIMALGTFLNSLMYMPYQLQLAHGWTRLAARTNVIAVLVIIPSLLEVVPRFGAIGATWVWLALNLGYVLIQVQVMHRRILRSEAARWYLNDVAAPLSAAGLVMLVASAVAPQQLQDRLHWVTFLVASLIAALVASIAAAPAIRIRVAITVRALARQSMFAMRAGRNFRPRGPHE